MNVTALIGKTIKSVEPKDNDQILLTFTDGTAVTIWSYLSTEDYETTMLCLDHSEGSL